MLSTSTPIGVFGEEYQEWMEGRRLVAGQYEQTFDEPAFGYE